MAWPVIVQPACKPYLLTLQPCVYTPIVIQESGPHRYNCVTVCGGALFATSEMFKAEQGWEGLSHSRIKK
jgi:hypothetical protein